MIKKRRGKTIPPRLEYYYYHPPYGSRFWILMPFIDNEDKKFKDQIYTHLGELNFRPMFSAESHGPFIPQDEIETQDEDEYDRPQDGNHLEGPGHCPER